MAFNLFIVVIIIWVINFILMFLYLQHLRNGKLAESEHRSNISVIGSVVFTILAFVALFVAPHANMHDVWMSLVWILAADGLSIVGSALILFLIVIWSDLADRVGEEFGFIILLILLGMLGGGIALLYYGFIDVTNWTLVGWGAGLVAIPLIILTYLAMNTD